VPGVYRIGTSSLTPWRTGLQRETLATLLAGADKKAQKRTHPLHMPTDSIRALAAADTTRLIDFARACKAAARAVMLYPDGHPAIASTLGRIAQLTSPPILTSPMRLTVLANAVALDDQAPNRSDGSLAELAALLHSHLIGEMVVNPGGDADAWRRFLMLIGRDPESVRAEGGVARLWMTMAGRHVDLREIDYAEVLRERHGGDGSWAAIVAHCLHGESTALEAQARQLLLEAGIDPRKLGDLIAAIDGEAISDGRDEHLRASALVRLLDRIVRTVAEERPDQVEPVMTNLATALAGLAPGMMLAVLEHTDAVTDTPALVDAVVSHMSEQSVAGFVAQHALGDDTPMERLAQAFRTLVPEERRERVLSLAKEQAAESSAQGTNFDTVWEGVAQQLLTSYSDKAYVSDQYGRELSRSRTAAIDISQVSDDPPERMAAWLGSVSASELRRLDLALVTDLLRIETDPEQWASLMRPVVSLVEDLLLVGDFEPADQLIGTLVGERLSGGARRHVVASALDALLSGSLVRYTASHLASIDDAAFLRVKAMMLSLGDPVIRPLAEALTEETHARIRARLSELLIGFGASGRSEVERLKISPNAAVRRTAVHLLREFGGTEALPELTGLLNDREPQVQREAVGAILALGSTRAFAVLTDALTAGTSVQREAILTAISAARTERSVPMFTHLVSHVDHRGPLGDIYLRAIQSLGMLKDPEGIDALAQALRRGEWWAPRRTRVLRDAAAAALTRIANPEAVRILEEAAATGSRRVRAAARAHLTAASSGRRERT